MMKKFLMSIATVAALIFSGQSQAADEGVIVEIAPIELKEGVSEDLLILASKTLEKEFLAKQDGYIKRELLKEKEGHYIDIVYWASKDAANKALEVAMTSEACGAYFSLMVAADHDNPGEGIKHLSLLKSYKK